MIIAVDGPGGVGKSSVTQRIAKELNLTCINTGAMCRCVALTMIRNQISLDQMDQIEKILETIQIEFRDDNSSVYLAGEDVTRMIRTKEVNLLVSKVADIPMVRYKMMEMQRKMAEGKDVIMEGRDIGTLVFPNADVKFYLDADAGIRARRRFLQYQQEGINLDMTYEDVLRDTRRRDENDKNRIVGTLKVAEDAVYINTNHMTLEEVINTARQMIGKKKRR